MSEIKELVFDPKHDNEGGVMNEAWAIATSDLDTFSGLYSAPDFDATASYAVNDLVCYQNEIYKCTSIHGPAAWDAGNFELIEFANVLVSAAHVPAAGSKFVKLEVSDEDANLLHEMVGKKFSKSGKTTLNFTHPGSNKAAASWFKKHKNRPMVVIVKLANKENVQIGLPGAEASLGANYGSGTKENPESGWTGTIEAYAGGLAFYDHAIPTT